MGLLSSCKGKRTRGRKEGERDGGSEGQREGGTEGGTKGERGREGGTKGERGREKDREEDGKDEWKKRTDTEIEERSNKKGGSDVSVMRQLVMNSTEVQNPQCKLDKCLCLSYVFGFVLACEKSAHVFQKLSYSLCRLCL